MGMKRQEGHKKQIKGSLERGHATNSIQLTLTEGLQVTALVPGTRYSGTKDTVFVSVVLQPSEELGLLILESRT